jgi:ADP-heptose:LPS heptosyltransferase
MSLTVGRRYLFVLTGALGDIVRGFALLHALKMREPSAHVTWLVEDKWRSILDLHKGIDHVIVFHRRKGLRGALELFGDLRRTQVDIVLDLQRNFKSGVMSRVTPALERIGFHRLDGKEGNWLFNTRTISQHGDSISKTDHYLYFLEALGLRRPETVRFGLEDIDEETLIKGVLGESASPRIGIVLGSSWRSKDWFTSGYHRLIELLHQAGDVECVLLGDRSQQRRAEELMDARGDANVKNLVAVTTLSQLVGVIKSCRVVVGPDSGPGHIAAAVGVPYVTLFGPTNPVRVAPYGMERLAVRVDIGCAPCARRVCPGLDTLCMRSISPVIVAKRVSEALGASD